MLNVSTFRRGVGPVKKGSFSAVLATTLLIIPNSVLTACVNGLAGRVVVVAVVCASSAAGSTASPTWRSVAVESFHPPAAMESVQ
jgi:hypothetical protein